MKLGEALQQRADLTARIGNLLSRIQSNGTVQEGDDPAEQPEGLIAELETAQNDLLALVQRINATNNVAKLGNGQTIAEAIAERKHRSAEAGRYNQVVSAATVVVNRYSRSEIKSKSTFDPAPYRTKSDEASKRYRELDSLIQQANWTTDLV